MFTSAHKWETIRDTESSSYHTDTDRQTHKQRDTHINTHKHTKTVRTPRQSYKFSCVMETPNPASPPKTPYASEHSKTTKHFRPKKGTMLFALCV